MTGLTAAEDALPQIERTVLKSGVEVIRVTIRVTGRNGRQSKALTQSDFTLTENGVKQTISVYSATVESQTTTRYELGYSTTTPPSVEKRNVEVRLRGFRKRLRYEYVERPKVSGCGTTPWQSGRRARRA